MTRLTELRVLALRRALASINDTDDVKGLDVDDDVCVAIADAVVLCDELDGLVRSREADERRGAR